MAKDITACATTCDTFQKQKLIGTWHAWSCYLLANPRPCSVKVLKSFAWEKKLDGFASAFDSHKAALQRDLSMHASIRLEHVATTVSSVDGTVKSMSSKVDMVLLFQQLRSPEERELEKFVESKGGPEKFLQDEALMDELYVRSENLRAAGDSSPADESRQMISIEVDLKKELKKDLDQILKEASERSEDMFRALQITIQSKMEASMRREGDRIVSRLLAGPQDKIRDPVSNLLPRPLNSC